MKGSGRAEKEAAIRGLLPSRNGRLCMPHNCQRVAKSGLKGLRPLVPDNTHTQRGLNSITKLGQTLGSKMGPSARPNFPKSKNNLRNGGHSKSPLGIFLPSKVLELRPPPLLRQAHQAHLHAHPHSSPQTKRCLQQVKVASPQASLAAVNPNPAASPCPAPPVRAYSSPFPVSVVI